jgi:hypothetical protein
MDIDYRVQVADGEILRKAMNSGLKVLGEQGLHSLFYDLESNGASLEKGGSCSEGGMQNSKRPFRIRGSRSGDGAHIQKKLR